MTSFLPPAIAVLLGEIGDFKAKMAEAEAISAETDKKIGASGKLGAKAFLAVGVAVAAVAAESVHLASEFDAAMARINTQDNANLTVKQMKDLKNSVLDLAGPTAQAPEALADAMIHVYGSGLKGAEALDLLKVAAEGATIGHANLTDVTNALDAAVAVGIKGTTDYNQAMGELNATVGAGDMTMQNLAEALGGPMLATVKGYGLSITDVGAALAVFGDRNIRGAEAATELRMATQALAVPAASGGRALASIGLATTTLRNDLQQGGLKQALNDLNDHLLAAGYNSTTAGSLITQAFGKKAGGGLNVLMDSLASSTSNFNDKFKDVAESGKTFSKDWAMTQDTLAFKIKSLGSELEALGVKFGTALIPAVSSGIAWLEHFGRTIGNAVNSPGGHAAIATLKADWQDVSRFLKEAAGASRDTLAALAPTAEFIAKIFLGALAAVGKVLANVVGPGLREFTGFLRDNTGVVKVLSEVALAGLIARLLYLKAVTAVDMFTKIVTGAGAAATAVSGFTKAAASGAIFDTMRTKVSAASDAVKAMGVSTEAAAAAEKAAAVQTGLASAAASASAGNMALLSAATKSAAVSAEIEAAATEAQAAKTSLLAAAAGISAAKVQALAAASTEAAAAQDAAAASAEGTAGKLGLMIPVLGAVALGAGMLGTKLGEMMGVGDHTKQDLVGLTSTMLDVGEGSASSTKHLQAMAVQLAGMGKAMHHMDSDNATAVQGMKDLDSSVAQLVTGGHADQAATSFNSMRDALVAQGYSLGYINDQLFPAYNRALADTANSNREAALGTDNTTVSLAEATKKWHDNAGAAQGTADAVQAVADAYSTLSDSLKASSALDAFKKDMLDVKDVVEKNGGALKDNTAAGLANRDEFRKDADAILANRDAQIKHNMTVGDANKMASDQAAELIKVWIQAGANKDQVQAYAKELGLVPKDLNTNLTVTQVGLDAALEKLGQINKARLTAGGSGIVAGSGGVGFRAAGGWVDGPGTTTSDSVPMMLSNREFVVSAAGAARVPAALLEAINRGDLNKATAVLGSGTASGGPSFGGGYSAGSGDTVVNVYVQDPGQPGWRVAKTVRTEVLRYQQRNSSNNLSLPGARG